MKTHYSNTHIIEYDYDMSDDKDKEVYIAELVLAICGQTMLLFIT